MSRTVIGHSRIFPSRIGTREADVRPRLRNFTALLAMSLCPRSHPFPYFCTVRQRALGNEYLWPTSPRPWVPARENLRVPNSRHSRRRNSLRIKLQIYSTAAPCLRVQRTSRSSWMRSGERITLAIVHISCTRLEFRTLLGENRYGRLDTSPDLESRSQVFGFSKWME